MELLASSPEIGTNENDLAALRRDSEITILPMGSPEAISTRSRSSTASGLINFINHGSRSNISLTSRTARQGNLMSLFRFLVLELNLPKPHSQKPNNATDVQEQQYAYEQLAEMVQVPWFLERFVAFGLLVCFNSFLTLFTLVPLKIVIISCQALMDLWTTYRSTGTCHWNGAVKKLHFIKRDSLNLLIIVFTVVFFSSPVLDISRLYHDIRGQAHLKLYVTFGILELIDKLLSSVGQEILTVLNGIPLSTGVPFTVGAPVIVAIRARAKLAVFLLLALLYAICHSYVLIYQCISLNVAANSYSNALLTLLLSNQFAELKGAVFKKFDREGLFQMSMSDLTERFQLAVMLFVIALRNLAQLSSTQLGLIPTSWSAWNNWLGAIVGPAAVVLGSEVFVDWLKHSFIAKFNRIRPTVYNNFLYVLSVDFMNVFTDNSRSSSLHEMSDYITLAKRLGLPTLPLCICFLRISLRDLKQVFIPTSSVLGALGSILCVLLTFMVLLVARLMCGLILLRWARIIKQSHELRQQALRDATTPVSEVSSVPDFLKEPLVSPRESSVDPDSSFLQSHSDASSQYEIDTFFVPGVPNTEVSSINPKLRAHLYDQGEPIPPTMEERRNEQVKRRRNAAKEKPKDSWDETLKTVHRYKMSSKRIW